MRYSFIQYSVSYEKVLTNVRTYVHVRPFVCATLYADYMVYIIQYVLD